MILPHPPRQSSDVPYTAPTLFQPSSVMMLGQTVYSSAGGQTKSPSIHGKPPSCPFLRLPPIIRRQIYELLPVRVKYVTSFRGEPTDQIWKDKPVAVLVLRYVERSVVQTCRQLAAEAEPILEIETMKLGPPSFVVAMEYFHHVPEDIRSLRKTQVQNFWQRLRLTAKDRGDKDLEDQRILMWSRILHLNLLSEKRIRIGIYIGPHIRYPFNEYLLSLQEDASRIKRQEWWHTNSDQTKPVYECSVDWEGCPANNLAAYYLYVKGMLASGVEDEGKLRREFGVDSFKELLCTEREL